VLLGSSTKEHVLESISYLNASEAEKDYSAIVKDYLGSMKGSCMYCNHCLPCPSQIDIAAVTRCLDIALLDEGNIPQAIKSQYRALEHHAGECTACGSCEERCPFSVPVIQNMEKTAGLFE
jgi:predicted aldo/keto reductase-like oxidoreductase